MLDAVVLGTKSTSITEKNRTSQKILFDITGVPARSVGNVGNKAEVTIEGKKPTVGNNPCGCTKVIMIKNHKGRWELTPEALLKLAKCFKGHANEIGEHILATANSA